MRELQVSFDSHGGTLRGVLHIPHGKKKSPCVLFLFGLTETKHEEVFLFRDISRILVKSGIASLRVDYRGMGDSDGESGQFTVWNRLEDAVSEIKFILNREEIDGKRIGVLGSGSGGFIAALITGKAPVKAMMLFNAVADEKARWEKGIMPESFSFKSLNKKGFDLNGLNIGKRYFQSISASEGKNIQSIGKFKGPLNIVHDRTCIVPVSEALIYKKAAGSNIKQMVVLSNVSTQTALERRGKIIRLTKKWFSKHL